MIKVSVNGKIVELPKGFTISDMITELGYDDKWTGVAINTIFVPKQNHTDRILEDGNSIEILSPVVGG